MAAGIQDETGDGGIGRGSENNKIAFVLNRDMFVRFQRSEGFAVGPKRCQPPDNKSGNAEEYDDADDNESSLNTFFHSSPRIRFVSLQGRQSRCIQFQTFWIIVLFIIRNLFLRELSISYVVAGNAIQQKFFYTKNQKAF